MDRLSFLSPKTVVRESPIQGRGLFARAAIAKGEIVAVKGGHIIDRATLARLQPTLGPAEIQIADDLFICPVTAEEREGSMVFSNHSCDPNIGVQGQIVFVAMRDIAEGEELTHDWAMTDDSDETMECRCGAANCRGRISGKDWQMPELQRRYAGYFSAYLAAKIARGVALFFLIASSWCNAQEITLEEIKVEAVFVSPLELPLSKAVDQIAERLRLRDEEARERELRNANKSALTNLLELTRYSPIPLGGSDPRVDEFLLQNYTRPDLNPREDNPLFRR